MSAWWEFVATTSLQALALALLASVCEWIFGRRLLPSQCAALWALVLFRLVTPPALSLSFHTAGQGILEGSRAVGDTSLPPVLFFLWLSGVGVFGACFAAREWKIGRLGRREAPAELRSALLRCAERVGLRRPPLVGVSDDFGPAVVGLFRPSVIVPRALIGQGLRLEHVLLHELQHVRRRDGLRGLLSSLVTLSYWFHPAAWLARRRLTELREIACDLAVAEIVGESRLCEYGETLAALALADSPAAHAASLAFIRRSSLLTRLEWLASPPPVGRRGSRALATLLLAGVALCCVPAPAPPFEIPPLSELRGCLQLRYAVHAALAPEGAALAFADPKVQ